MLVEGPWGMAPIRPFHQGPPRQRLAAVHAGRRGNEHRRFRALFFGDQVGIQLRIRRLFRHRQVTSVCNEAGEFGIGDRCHIDRKRLQMNGAHRRFFWIERLGSDLIQTSRNQNHLSARVSHIPKESSKNDALSKVESATSRKQKLNLSADGPVADECLPKHFRLYRIVISTERSIHRLRSQNKHTTETKTNRNGPAVVVF